MAASTGLAIPASAQQCPDVEVIFARGTHEPPGVGPTGEAFIDALRPQIGDRSLAVYPVNYPAIDQWATGVDGVRDASTRILSMTSTCPTTDLVLGGYSQGAAVAGFVTSAAVPDGVDPNTVPKPLQPEVAEHVAAVVLFGMPNPRAMNFLGEPPVTIGPLYVSKTATLCAFEDPVCSDGLNFAMHHPNTYNGNLTQQGAAFAASRLDSADVDTDADAVPR
ncbi:cutinase family protein [Mycolicibacterium vaccae]|uniref:cutinase family protein n=1 Tax=Mycolicibacterium vaccae TaxID=1810 RepID=UPI003CEBC88B